METQKTLNSPSNPKKESEAGRIRIPDFRLCFKATVIKTVCSWCKTRNIAQWISKESSEINPCIYGQLLCNKGGRNIQWRKDSLFNKWCLENQTATCKRMKLEHSLTSYTKINSKWIKDFYIRMDAIKLLEENIGRTL